MHYDVRPVGRNLRGDEQVELLCVPRRRIEAANRRWDPVKYLLRLDNLRRFAARFEVRVAAGSQAYWRVNYVLRR
jgi:hypothetical protein